MISYEPLWETMKQKKITKYRLVKYGISQSTITRLRKGEQIKLESIDKLCEILECEISDIIKYKPNKK